MRCDIAPQVVTELPTVLDVAERSAVEGGLRLIADACADNQPKDVVKRMCRNDTLVPCT